MVKRVDNLSNLNSSNKLPTDSYSLKNSTVTIPLTLMNETINVT